MRTGDQMTPAEINAIRNPIHRWARWWEYVNDKTAEYDAMYRMACRDIVKFCIRLFWVLLIGGGILLAILRSRGEL